MSEPQMPIGVDAALLERFESAWTQGSPQPIERFLPEEKDASYLATLEELVRVELRLAWQSLPKAEDRATAETLAETPAEQARVETYLQRFPRLDRPEIVLRLVQREYSVRKQAGHDVSPDEYRRRFPGLRIDPGHLEPPLPMVSVASYDAQLAETLAPSQPGGEKGEGLRLSRFGNYESLEEIGRGGMGVVYRARQQGADRTVALKVIRRDCLEATPRNTHGKALDRFRHEAQAAARLEHENIVTVYEVGEVDGQPFFSMRYVEGQSLAEILRNGPIENRRAANYLEPVARALQEAHGQGILHRDLKPQNILVDAKTDRALVADFGLAKLSEGSDEITRAGEIMGTPSYMSPEQARDSAGVAAETDVYALGATLYHILTGRPPFQAATPVETLRQVMDEEPAPPRQLDPSIDRDLETICIKCLQKEPSRRYDSSEALADDLGRYLRGEPIVARPLGVAGRTWRWCRRNPVVAVLATLTVTFLVVAAVSSTVGYVTTSAALAESEESSRMAREAVQNFYTKVAEDTLLDQDGMQPLRRELLQEALDYYLKFIGQRADDPAIQDELATAHYHIGCIAEEIDSPQKALASYEHARTMQDQLVLERPQDPQRLQALGNTLNAIGRVLRRMQQPEKALAACREALKRRRQLAASVPQESEFQRTLANSYMNVGIIQKESGQAEEARRHFQEAQAVRTKLLKQGRGNPKIRTDLAMGYYNLANLAVTLAEHHDARQSFQDAIGVFEGLLEENPKSLDNQGRLATCYRRLGDLKCDAGQWDQAMALYEKALGRMKTLAAKNPTVADYQADLSRLYMNVGQLQYEQETSRDALSSYQRAFDVLELLAEEYPDVPEYRRDFAVTLREIGLLESDAEEYGSAQKNLESAAGHLEALVEQFPDHGDFKIALVETMAALQMNFGLAEHQHRRAQAALESLQQAVHFLEALVKKYPAAPRYRRDLAVSLRTIGLLQAEAGEYQTARTHLETALKHLAELVDQFPHAGDFQSQLAKTRAVLEGLQPADPEQE